MFADLKNKLNFLRIELYVLMIFVLLRIVSVFNLWPYFVGGDSISYRKPSIGGFDDWQYFPQTLWGDSIRPWFPVTAFHFFGSDTKIYLFQSLISILSWSFFLWTIIKNFSDTILRKSILITVSIIGLSAPVIGFNKLIYSESLTISATILTLSIYMKIFLENRINLSQIFMISILLFTISTTRANLFPFHIVSIFLLLTWIYWKKRKHLLLIACGIFMASGILSVIYTMQNNHYLSNYISREFITLSYYSSEDNLGARSFLEVLNQDKSRPECVNVPEVPLKSGTQMEWGASYSTNSKCLGAIEWAKKNWMSLILKWIYNNPKEAIYVYFNSFNYSTNHQNLYSYISVVPASINDIFWPRVTTDVALPDWIDSGPGREGKLAEDPIFFWLAILGLLLALNRRTINFRCVSFQALTWIFTASIFSLFAGIFMIVGPPGEVWRIGFIPWLMIRLIVYVSTVSLIVRYALKGL